MNKKIDKPTNWTHVGWLENHEHRDLWSDVNEKLSVKCLKIHQTKDNTE